MSAPFFAPPAPPASRPAGAAPEGPDVARRATLLRLAGALAAAATGAAPAVASDAGSGDGAGSAEPLRVTAIPDEAPTELLRRFEPLGAWLGERLGRPIEFRPVVDYAGAVEALVSGRVDLAWLGGFTFVQANRRSDGGVEPLVQRVEDESFRSVFVTRADSGIDSLADLVGRELSFGSPSSTSGHLMPRHHLLAAGVDPERDLRVAYSGAHDATALAVSGGRVDAGALNASVWESLVADDRIDPDETVVFFETPGYPDYNWTAGPATDAPTREAIREAFLALSPDVPAEADILALQRASRFVPTEPGNYDRIESAARAAGLID